MNVRLFLLLVALFGSGSAVPQDAGNPVACMAINFQIPDVVICDGTILRRA